MPIIIDARNMGGGSIGSAAGGDTSSGTRNNVTLAAPWDESKEYLKGDLATSNGDLYQAQKSVPAGVKIANEDYWHIVVAGDKADETKKLREDVGSLDDLETESKDNLVAAINEVGNIQPDWNQNDETKKDYIKNRPFYTEPAIEEIILNDVSITPSSYFAYFDLENPFVVGRTYHWVDSLSGEAGDAVCELNPSDCPSIVLLTPEGEASSLGGVTIKNVNSPLAGMYNGASKLKLTITCSVPGKVHKLDSKYLPEYNVEGYDLDKILELIEGGNKCYVLDEFGNRLYYAGTKASSSGSSASSSSSSSSSTVANMNIVFSGVVNTYYKEVEYRLLDWVLVSKKAIPLCESVLYTRQSLTDEQKARARANIDAVDTYELGSKLPATQTGRYSWDVPNEVNFTNILAIHNNLITGIVTADKVTSPDHTTDLVNYEAFQAAVPMVQQMGITGATVGQTIKVKAVDDAGRPTQWEAANMASGSGGKMRWQKVKEITLEEQTNTVIIDKDENNVPITDYAPIAIMARYDIPADDTQTSTNGSIWIFPSATNSNASIRVISTVTAWKTTNRLHNVTAFFGNSSGIATISTSAVNGLACDNEADACMDGIKMFINNSEDHFPIQTKIIIQVLSDRG